MTTTISGRQELRRQERPRGVRRRRAALVGRILLAAFFVVAAVLTVLAESSVRQGEVWFARHVLEALSGARTLPEGIGSTPTVMFTFDDRYWYAMRVTVECAVAFYFAGVLVLAGGLSLVPRLSRLRILAATLTSIGTLGLLNQVRLLMLEMVFSHLGREAFEWAHSLVGSFLMLFGIAGCLLLFFVLVVKRRQNEETR